VKRAFRRAIPPLIALLPLAAGAQYALQKSSVDGGGGTSNGAGWELTVTVGQPDAGIATGSDWILKAGFLTDGEPVVDEELIFADGFEKP
jgi:hypothetical protein